VRMLGLPPSPSIQETPRAAKADQPHSAVATLAPPAIEDIQVTDMANLVSPTRMPPADSPSQDAPDPGRRRITDASVAITPSADHPNGTGDRPGHA
jgi:hypothetical protein